ncbi:MAG: hypothetical protein QG576_104, partial [Bacteroidota bacterium]|nr:hypothetical protein [Bacteroidota bacterium]
MRFNKILALTLSLLFFSSLSFSQDKRTIETKVADLLAQFPANDLRYTDNLMDDMIALGEQGIKKICDQVIPAGTGDDTNARYAIESFSRFLSQNGKENEEAMWEKICISYAIQSKDSGIKDFFIRQLQQIGGELSVEALKVFLSDKENCNPAVAALTAIGGSLAEHVLAESLKNRNVACAEAVMNALASLKSDEAVNEYIIWSSDENLNTKASAYNALAQSGSPLAYPVLMSAAKSKLYRWESTGATAALLTYAKVTGQNGDVKTADKICKLLISKCNDKSNIQNKTAALEIYSGFHGVNAMPYILKAASHTDNRYRNAAINMSAAIHGNDVVKKWIGFFPKAMPEAKPEILRLLGDRGNELALPVISSSLSNSDPSVRSAAASAIAKLNGNKSVPDLIEYLLRFDNASDQEAAVSAFKSVSGNDEILLLRRVLKDGSTAAKKSAIDLIGWNGNNTLFPEIMPFTSSPDEQVRAAAFKALASLAGPEDQEEMISLLSKNDDPEYISYIQDAIVNAANETADPAKRSSVILKAIAVTDNKEKLIPVLAKTGGREALALVLNEFENGNRDMRTVCFKALTSWCDHSASSALYDICASGNKTYQTPSFDGYVKQIKTAVIPDEQKLLLYRKIMPYALTPEQKNTILKELGKLKTYQTLFYVDGYLDDPETAATAANSAIDIALPQVNSTTGLYGNIAREILEKAVPKLTGPESDYQKEMVSKYLSVMLPDRGFEPMFNGIDLSGWQGLVGNPVKRALMKPAELAKKQAEADKKVPLNWSVKDGCIWFNGSGENLCSIKEYGDFEMLVDWKISRKGDSGIYLRGSPQVQIWDTSRVEEGAQVGSGGLYNNQKNPSKPLKVADNPVGDWNTFRIMMTGEKVSVWLNGELVADNVTMENYWDRSIPIFPKGSVELQAHGTDLAFRDIYIREINENEYNLTSEERSEGFVALFNGRNLENWIGNKDSYVAEEGMIVIKPEQGSGGNLYTEKEYADFIFRFEFQLTPGANNGLGIRTPLTGDAAYVGMELQILDNPAPVYANLE